MFRIITVLITVFVSCLLCGGEFSLLLNEEYALVKNGKDSYRFNLHPLPPVNAQLMIRNGKKSEYLSAEIITSSPVPESVLSAPYHIMPSMGQVNINVLENSAKSIVLEIEYFLTAWGNKHGTPLMTRKMFGFGRIFGKYTFTKGTPGMKAEISARCLNRAPFKVDRLIVQFPGVKKVAGPIVLDAGKSLSVKLDI